MRRIFLTLLFLFILLIVCQKVSALECEQITNIQEKITCLENVKKNLGQKASTLASQIQYLNSQIALAALRISETEKNISKTQLEIEKLSTQIEGLDQSLNHLSKLLINKIVNSYKKPPLSFLEVVLNTDTAFDFLNQVKYLKTTQQNNQQLLFSVQRAKTNYEEQKKIREEKKKELNELENQLIAQKNELNYQNKQKQILLTETQNDEVKYQQLLSQALAEYNAVQNAVISGSIIGPIKKGDPIALVGNSGYPYCSTGAHLHFEVRVNNSWVNAENYLISKTLPTNITDVSTENVTIGSGSWDWPLSDPIQITQRYGSTPWSWRYSYSGGIHTGIDMISDGSQIIRAPADGILYSSAQSCGGATINVKYIDHGNGIISFYLHVQ